MPTLKKDDDIIECIAIKKVSVEWDHDELETLKASRQQRKKDTNFAGLTKMVEPGGKVKLKRKDAVRLQEARAVKVAL